MSKANNSVQKEPIIKQLGILTRYARLIEDKSIKNDTAIVYLILYLTITQEIRLYETKA